MNLSSRADTGPARAAREGWKSARTCPSVNGCYPPLPTVFWGYDECVFRADTGRRDIAKEDPLPRSEPTYKLLTEL